MHEALELPAGERPWVGRANVRLNGVRRQADEPNRCHKLLDHRWAKHCKSLKIPRESCPVSDVFSDTMKSDGYQKANGMICMQTNTRIYWHNGDRVALPEEHFILNGWSIDELDFSEISAPWPAEIYSYLEPEKSQKRKQQGKAPDVALRKLSGNFMGVGEVGTLLYCSALAQDTDLWENAPSNFVFDLSEEGIQDRVKLTIVDLENIDSYHELIVDEEGGAGGDDDDGQSD